MNDIQTVEAPDPIDGIAIIGMVGKFPGANSVDELWQNLCQGIESITFFEDRDLDPSIDPLLSQDPSYIKARGIIAEAESFDAAFFGINPREAEVIDPQARVFLELVFAGLETAGYDPDTFDGLIGLYAGCSQNTYFTNHLHGRQDIIDRVGELPMMFASEKDYLTTRASYKLDLKGPSVSISTACSSSLVAVAQAFQALTSYQCDLAVAGAVSISSPQHRGYLYQEDSIFSKDGHCRAFDAQANGTVFGNGGGLVVLKRLEEALADGDKIYAVIRGVGVNNDGADKVSFSAPSVDGQAQAIAMAQAYADFHPDTISYIETHGTGTQMGDPIEVAALTQAFRLQTDARQFCALGSIKSSIGHLADAAGVVGLIKTALALDHKQLPPSINFTTPNPKLDLEHSPFYVNTELVEWPAGSSPRRAGVSSFGVGGTNVHLVVEEAPPVKPTGKSRPQQLLLLSAKNSTALATATSNLGVHLASHPDIDLADVAYTLRHGRKAFNYRSCIVCQNPADAVSGLSGDSRRVMTRQVSAQNPDVVFMFPGQGSQYVNMGVNFYHDEPVFRQIVDRSAEILTPLIGVDLRSILYPTAADKETAAISLAQTCFTQPALFVIEYALAQLWQSWGVVPQATIGHSIGEYVSACLAGVFSLENALLLVATRGRLMWDLPRGSMLSVRLSATAIAAHLSADLSVAAINSPSLCVVSGSTESIERLQAKLESQEIVCRLLHTSHAFHSTMMDSIVDPFAAVIKRVKLAPPQIPFVSTVTGDWITDEQATDPHYWATHLRQTVKFAPGIQTIWQQPGRVLLEVGPRTTTATLARQQAKDPQQQIAISALSDTPDNEWTALLQAVGQLWLAGVSINWANFDAGETRSRIPLPTYPFDRQHVWIDPLPHPSRSASHPPAANSQPHIATPMSQPQPPAVSSSALLINLLKEIFTATSGLEMMNVAESTTFLEMGLDSLSLTQIGIALKKKFQVKVTLRQLLEIYPTFSTLADFLIQTLPPELLPASPVIIASVSVAPVVQIELQRTISSNPATQLAGSSAIETVIAQQLQLMSQQLALLGHHGSLPMPAIAIPPEQGTSLQNVESQPSIVISAVEAQKTQSSDLLRSRIELPNAGKNQAKTLTDGQRTHLAQIIQRYTQKTQKSKEFAGAHRAYLADPRTVSGFNPTIKEMVYPIVVDRSSGTKLWDLDGNEYVDLVNGFGLNLFGWSPAFVTEAITNQLQLGMEIGPQSPLVGEVAKLMCELTGFDRAAFCNTGSEAVLGAIRIARTVTGRDLIAIFAGAYHGILDEVVVRGTKQLRSIPAAPGIPPEMVANILVIDYDAPDALEILKSRAHELAAVMVEPVQSRSPEYQPRELLHQLRDFTQESGIALIFDEVVTGFRIHPGGAQAHFGVKADIATYGKIVGGGLPIGIIAGTSKYMDALDGGYWQFGDDSIPEVGVTYFAGTFVRHPLALASAKAVLTHLKQRGASLQQQLNTTTDRFVAELTAYFQQVGAPFTVHNFGSLFMVKYPPNFLSGDLLFYLLREKGIHIYDRRPCFLTTAHTDIDLALVMTAFKDSIAELQATEFLAPLVAIASVKEPLVSPQLKPKIEQNGNNKVTNRPPQPDAKLGRDRQGNPAWFIPDPDRAGKYLQVETHE
ncbi:aminotransferase class III-fold pyridoxal phosphate-dependent enzyme [Chamaesiphon sp. VAR_48_metabat_135_sub]|uniref:aminotransferase class III-fold pyridoxal phosphate-dependent enzyme n=1 Tax=Chamaesiphon sp. VAR_48_metabat_135_sub TaxID=2964699 RepID=UPI00286A10BF|nr:aminotransferase class III-fold pyridoxal phosphate-dependent enzyme [Chamaesiphon sp. VAR_48_metabat_135_sub]